MEDGRIESHSSFLEKRKKKKKSMTVNLIRKKSLQSCLKHSNLREELMEPLRKTVVREYCRDLPTPCSKRTDKKNYSLSFSFNALSNFLSSACSAAQYKKEVWMACHSIDLRHGPLAVEKSKATVAYTIQ